MDTRALRRWGLRALVLVGILAGIWALLLLARSVENSANFNRRQPWILLFNICGVLILGVALARKLWRLVRDFRDHVPGSRLTARTVGMFGTLVVVPLLIIYLFSLEFLNYGIDSWFRVEIKQGLNDALVLSRSALDLRLREQARRTEFIARAIAAHSGTDLLVRLDAERRDAQATAITVYAANGRPLVTSSDAGSAALPGIPPAEVLMQIAAGRSYVRLEPLAGGRYSIVTAAPLPRAMGAPQRRYVLVD